MEKEPKPSDLGVITPTLEAQPQPSPTLESTQEIIDNLIEQFSLTYTGQDKSFRWYDLEEIQRWLKNYSAAHPELSGKRLSRNFFKEATYTYHFTPLPSSHHGDKPVLSRVSTLLEDFYRQMLSYPTLLALFKPLTDAFDGIKSDEPVPVTYFSLLDVKPSKENPSSSASSLSTKKRF